MAPRGCSNTSLASVKRTLLKGASLWAIPQARHLKNPYTQKAKGNHPQSLDYSGARIAVSSLCVWAQVLLSIFSITPSKSWKNRAHQDTASGIFIIAFLLWWFQRDAGTTAKNNNEKACQRQVFSDLSQHHPMFLTYILMFPLTKYIHTLDGWIPIESLNQALIAHNFFHSSSTRFAPKKHHLSNKVVPQFVS